MNIFSSLTEGRGRLSETNLSAFLAFMLTPHRAHGLSEIFLRSFLKATANASGDPSRFNDLLNEKAIDVEIGLEVRYPFGETSRTVDIEIKLFEKTDGEESRESHRLIIENKIRPNAAQEQQFKEEFESVLSEIDPDTRITAVFLTPTGDAISLIAEYEQLVLVDRKMHCKAWLRWNDPSSGTTTPTIVDLIRKMLGQEAAAEIEPVSEYTRHTLKAFVQFVSNLLPADTAAIATNHEAFDVVEERTVSIGGKRYQLARLSNKSIKIFDGETGDECVAKPLLRSLNTEAGLNVGLYLTTGRKKNTRQLGREIMDKLPQ